MLQGVGGGIFPLCFGIIRDEFPRERVPASIGLISAILGIGGGVGLVLGGVLADAFSYHVLFWLGAAMAVIATVAAELVIPESPVRTPGRVDVRGAVILAAGLVLPLYAIGQANAWGWGSARTLGLIGAGLVILAPGCWSSCARREPLVNVRLLLDPPVAMTNLATLFVGFGMFGSFLLIPQLAEAPEATGYGFALSATGAGLLMLPGSIAMLGAGPLSGRLSGRYTPKLPLALGGVITASGLLFLGVAHGSELQVMFGSLVMSIGIGFAFAAMPNLIVESVPPERTGEATGFNQLVRSVGSSLGSQISAAILAGSVVSGAPTDAGYTAAFLVSAGVALAAGDRLGADPARGRRHHAGGRARGRARMTRVDAVRNRAAVLAAAEAVFAEHGTDAGVDLVAERAGVGKATVYRSFPTKEALVAEVVTRQLDAWLAANASAEGDALTVLRQLLRAAAEAKVLGEGTGLASLAVARERWLATLETILARADGSVRADATASEITTLFGGVCRVLAARGEADPAVWHRHAELVADAFRP